MSLVEHLTELRSRLFKCTIAVFVLGTVSLVFAKPIFGMLMRPVLDALPPEGRSLIYTSGIEEINVLMKVGVYCGIFLTTPVILWQIWGFVSPGLYPEERRYASPFVVLGSVAFLTGAMFCYFVVLPSMFKFLLNEEDTMALEERLDTAKLTADDALRFLRVGDAERAGQLAKQASTALTAAGDGQLDAPQVVPSASVEMAARLEGLGKLVDAVASGLGSQARGVLKQAVEKRVEAVEAFGKKDFVAAATAMDASASLLAGVAPTHSEELAGVWKLEKELAEGHARNQAERWTRPMLTMDEQLSLVLLLILAFGIIFEMPLVMAVLGIVGVVQSRWLFRYQRHAFVVCLIAAAVITPTGDVVNLSLMAGPMLMCYELGVLAVWLIEKRRSKAAATTDIAPVP
ncbi:twin-arginine translocase subunit TatC [Corallococcus sp. M34]|uniref:twin-arginine translocase subunit TatC n=1 Tax=Citreicoccus inhibens TaxID=2849499 RepID=UPI001C25068B|nr:twin-arginine translocase subunit TatC [Citreicoccus inhibens]MBU8896119.1 twin-arginine translocase subunit TatC [Citreicoccus inhibens]